MSDERLSLNPEPASTHQWIGERKPAIIDAVRSGWLTLDAACELYQLSIAEFLESQSFSDGRW